MIEGRKIYFRNCDFHCVFKFTMTKLILIAICSYILYSDSLSIVSWPRQSQNQACIFSVVFSGALLASNKNRALLLERDSMVG